MQLGTLKERNEHQEKKLQVCKVVITPHNVQSYNLWYSELCLQAEMAKAIGLDAEVTTLNTLLQQKVYLLMLLFILSWSWKWLVQSGELLDPISWRLFPFLEHNVNMPMRKSSIKWAL